MWAEDEVEHLANTPGLSFATIEAAKLFPDHVRRIDKARAHEFVAEYRAKDREKIVEASGAVSEIHGRLDELHEAVSNGDVAALDVLNEAETLTTRLKDARRRHEALVRSEAHYSEIESDPSAYFERYYSKYPGLKDRRITLADFLAERGFSR